MVARVSFRRRITQNYSDLTSADAVGVLATSKRAEVIKGRARKTLHFRTVFLLRLFLVQNRYYAGWDSAQDSPFCSSSLRLLLTPALSRCLAA